MTHPSASTALELLLLDATAKSQHTSIQLEFIFQNYLAQLAATTASDSFRICQDMFNRILRAQTGEVDTKFHEHVGPAGIFVGGIMGIMAVPAVMGLSASVAMRQARKERVFEDPGSRQPLHRSKSMNAKAENPTEHVDSSFRASASASFDVRRPSSPRLSPGSTPGSSSATHFSNKHSALMSQSQPNLQPSTPITTKPSPRPISPAIFTDEHIVRTLQTHYYSTENQFLQCLQDISLRLRLVPKVARQSALRIELTGLDKWLPADVCLPNLCSSDDAHDRIVQIVESDCTILNSAERVFTSHILNAQVLILGPIFITSGGTSKRFDFLPCTSTKSETLPRSPHRKSLLPPIRSQPPHQRKNLT